MVMDMDFVSNLDSNNSSDTIISYTTVNKVMIAQIVGIVLCLFNLWLLKNSETVEYLKKSKPVLKMWMVLIIVPCMFIPLLGLALALILSIIIWLAYPCNIIKLRKPFSETKLGKFFNKEIS